MTATELPAVLCEKIADVRGELNRVDSKANTLLTLAVAVLTVGLAGLSQTHLPIAAEVTGVLALTLVGAAVALLIGAVRPNLRGDHGLVYYSTRTPSGLLAELSDTSDVELLAGKTAQLVWLSCATVRKFRRVRHAVDLLLAALLTTAVTAALIIA